LHTDKGWNDYMNMISELIDDLTLAAEVKEAVSTSASTPESGT